MLEKLKEHELYAKFEKYDFWLEKVKFLGYIVSKDGILVDPKKVEAVIEWQALNFMTEVGSLLG